ncbi:MAG: acyl carrier protein [Gaiellaceae bacterium MAG52_C11]|nr:acyl carrier protein [Candidatus Gaiellasilicea maunaloa]
MRDRLRNVLAGVLEVRPEEICADMSAEDVAGWDSLRQLEVMLALELEYGVRIPADAMLELQSVPAIEEFLTEHGAG